MIYPCRRICATVTLLIAALHVNAEPTLPTFDITPGSKTVKPQQLREYHARWSKLQPGTNEETGTTFEERLVRVGDRLLHTQTVRDGNGLIVKDDREFDSATLRPLSFNRSLENGPPEASVRLALLARGLKWTGTAVYADGKDEPFDYTTEVESFDGWVAGLTIASLPLAVGYKARLPAMVQLQRATYALTLNVVERRDHVATADITVPVWVVETEWVNVADGSMSAAGANESGGAYLIAVDPTANQPHVIDYRNASGIITWTP